MNCSVEFHGQEYKRPKKLAGNPQQRAHRPPATGTAGERALFDADARARLENLRGAAAAARHRST